MKANLILLGGSLLLLTACGQTGPLYLLPEPAPSVAATPTARVTPSTAFDPSVLLRPLLPLPEDDPMPVVPQTPLPYYDRYYFDHTFSPPVVGSVLDDAD